ANCAPILFDFGHITVSTNQPPAFRHEKARRVAIHCLKRNLRFCPGTPLIVRTGPPKRRLSMTASRGPPIALYHQQSPARQLDGVCFVVETITERNDLAPGLTAVAGSAVNIPPKKVLLVLAHDWQQDSTTPQLADPAVG